ncbi:hypothetical protein G6F24_018169 [Rhizopus arrhizus]|nr:hypothetical protein G6F24_018169 [Rhizopus arrhizus]
MAPVKALGVMLANVVALVLSWPVALTATLSPCTTPFSVPAAAASREPSYTLPAAVSAPVIALGVMLAVVVVLATSV